MVSFLMAVYLFTNCIFLQNSFSLKEKISKYDKRQQNGVAMIEKAKDKMRGEGEINELSLALADKIMAFHKVHTQTNDKLSELRSEYISL